MKREDTADALMRPMEASEQRYGPSIDDFWRMLNRNMRAKRITRKKVKGDLSGTKLKRGYRFVASGGDEKGAESLIECVDNDGAIQIQAGGLYASVKGFKQPERIAGDFLLEVVNFADADTDDTATE